MCSSLVKVPEHCLLFIVIKVIVSLILTLGCKNEKRPSGPIEHDIEAGNLVKNLPLIFSSLF